MQERIAVCDHRHTEKLIANPLGKGRRIIIENPNHIFDDGGLEGNSVCRCFRYTGNDDENYNAKLEHSDV